MRVGLILFLGFLLEAQQSPQAPAEKPGRVSGKVLNALTGEPIRKATVALQPAGAQQGVPGGGGQGPFGPGGMLGGMRAGMAASTDASGAFLIEGVPPGNYRVAVEKTGFLRAVFGGRTNSLGSQVSVTPGADKADINVRLVPQGVVTGRIVDEDGDPLEGVGVSLLRPQATSPTRGGFARRMLGMSINQTNDRGEFRITNVSPGRYYVQVQRFSVGANAVQIGGLEYGYPRLFFPGVESLDQAQRIEVTPGQEFSGVQMTLRKTRVFRIRGSFSGAAQPESSDARQQGRRGGRELAIQLRQEGSVADTGGPPMSGLNATLLRRDGTFEIANVTPGAYRLLATSFTNNGPRIVANLKLNVGNNNVDGIVLAPLPLPSLPGKVTIEGESTAINLKTIRLQALAGSGFPSQAEVTEDGKFLFSELSLDLYQFSVPSIPNAYVKAIRLGGQDIADSLVDFSGGGGGELEVVLSTKVARLSGSVEKQKPEDAPGVVVVTTPELKVINSSLRVESNGNFSLANLAPGEYRVFAFEELEPGATSDPDFLRKFLDRASTVRLAEQDAKTTNVKQVRYAEISSTP
ncbi:MAG: carboxypeptidase regulatory-like domain-containing protein [Bryobacter sp.]|jgi:hypothetical protein|nr:carboxypeptidase regulatory-like domain-containing protein [Bryobacter sp. CoA8 C33]